jgi:hypothetical protein
MGAAAAAAHHFLAPAAAGVCQTAAATAAARAFRFAGSSVERRSNIRKTAARGETASTVTGRAA